MRTHRALFAVLVTTPVLGYACGGDEGGVAEGAGGSTITGGSSGTGADASSTGGTSGDGGLFIPDTGPSGCSADSECDGGVCVEGACCPSAAQACGKSCCASTEVCLFDACVTPGKPCQTPADCDPGQYCETALGDATDGGPEAGSPDGGKCTEPLPAGGRCVDLPPICGEDGGAPDGGDGGCVEKCEYHPPLGQLDAVVEWQWGLDPAPTAFPAFADVWATPTVGRIYDANCDGNVDESDPPNVVFVSGDADKLCCSCNGAAISTCRTGVLRALSGRDGQELWSLDKAKPGGYGFAGLSIALGDLDDDARMDVVAMTGDGYLAWIDGTGFVKALSDQPVDGEGAGNFGWGGGIAIADMDGDGSVEIAYGRTLYSTTGGTITRKWVGTGGNGGGGGRQLSFFTDLDGAADGHLELVAGATAYLANGTPLWDRSAGLPEGFNAVADFDRNGTPEVVLVATGSVYILNGLDGTTWLGPTTLPGTGDGGPPTVADFDGDGVPEIGVAQANLYSMLKPEWAGGTLPVVWSTANHDLSSSVTGSSVFDFEGDGKAEVIYNDECFLWVYDGATGAVRFAALTTSFTATEASLVADVDGDGHSEIVMVSNGADPSSAGWKCDMAPWNTPDATLGRPAWVPPSGAPAYRGITVWGDKESSWVGTRALWNQHAYHVSNVCDSRDDACDAPNVSGSIPQNEKKNWTVPWLDNFRQNVQDEGIFDAPDATVSITVVCVSPAVVKVSIRNVGLAGLPAGVEAGVYLVTSGETLLGSVETTHVLLPGQTEVIPFTVPAGQASSSDTFLGRIIIDPLNKTFNECRDDNNESAKVTAKCGPT